MKIGILGGTFDPVHDAHIMIAKKAYEEFNLDKVLLMPSKTPPHKLLSEVSPVNVRLDMLRLAVEDIDYFEVSEFEINSGKAYSAEILTSLRQELNAELYFIIGSDSLFTLDTWYHPEVIFKVANILVARRDDDSNQEFEEKIKQLREKYNANIYEIKVDISNISSSNIRKLKDKKRLCEYVPEKVAKYIIDNELYSNISVVRRYTNAEIIKDLKQVLKPKRFEHTMGVARTAWDMAEALGENPNKAYLAGLLHDCAKNLSDEKKISICQKYGENVSEFEKNNAFLLHAKAGACLTKFKYGINDTDIYNAVKYHTTGRPEMSLLEKIIFTADYIEPGRTKQKHLKQLRKMAYIDIDETVYIILDDTLNYLEDSAGKDNIDSHTVEAYKFYKKLHKK